LDSIIDSETLPDEVVVSDDSKDTDEIRHLCAGYGNVRYVAGPRRGLCANRNNAVRHCSSDYIALIDDDGVVSGTFVKEAKRLAIGTSSRTVLTGEVVEQDNVPLRPTNPTFWGHFGKKPGRVYKNVHLNCNLFPRSAFEDAEFDEHIAYGYEDTDLCAQLLCKGYRIEYAPSLCNAHLPPRREESAQADLNCASEYARMYVTFKRYFLVERSYAAAAAFALLAPFHQAAHYAKKGRVRQLLLPFKDISRAVKAVLTQKNG
jgi:glycosyltransferase involved in cell wall biosynthesis